MPPAAFLDPASLDFSNIVADREEILRCNPQRHEFALLDAVILFDPVNARFAGYHDLRSDAWWTRGHIPGRPLFPGVLMIEAAAQLASVAWRRFTRNEGTFMGFAAVDQVKYRGPVEPPCRFVIIGSASRVTPRRTVASLQGFVDNRLVFEGSIVGIPI